MLTIDFIRKNVELVKQNIIARKFDTNKADIDLLLEVDQKRNAKQQELDANRQQRNENANNIKSINGKPPIELIAKGKELKEQGVSIEAEMKELDAKFQEIMLWIPNMALPDAPIGNSPDDNIEIKAWSKQTGYLENDKLSGAEGSAAHLPNNGSNNDGEFNRLPHWEIGKNLDIIDLENGAKVSGSRFYYLKKEGYLLAYGIFDMLMRKLLEDGFEPMYVPILVKDFALFGSSQFPADQDQIYKIENANIESGNQLYLVGSSEPSLFSYFADSMIDKEDLPKKVFTITPCFRSEAGSWGKDVRGIKRVHQFDKLEMDVIVEPNLEEAYKMHEYLLSLNEWLLQKLELPYHVINMCTADLGYAAAAKKYDVEVWIPSENSFVEIMSDSITTDFQSRRLGIKCKDKEGNKDFVYTLNNTGATHRLLIAIIEHYQQADGSIKVPEALRSYLNKEKIG